MPDVDGVMLTEHDEDGPVPFRVQLPPGVNVTVPVGEVDAAKLMSATVAVQLVA